MKKESLPRRFVYLGILFGLTSVFVLHIGLRAQEQPSTNAAVRNLNNQLLDVYARLLSGHADQAFTLHSQAAGIIRQRSAALEALIAQNPSEALKLAFAPDALANLAAAFPDSAAQLESHGTWQGEIEYLVGDSEDMRTSQTFRRMSYGEEHSTFNLPARSRMDCKAVIFCA